MNIEYKYNVSVEQFFKDEGGLCTAHWEEIANNKEAIKLKPDVDKYVKLQELGCIKNIAAYVEGVLIGYTVIFLTPLLHNMDDIEAYVDVIYVHPDYRATGVGIALVNKTEELARDSGASLITHHTKPHHRALTVLLQRKKYKLAEYKYSKLLKEV